MKYLLIGIAGTYNYGCEAIIRGTEAILRVGDPEAEIDYASLLPDYDRATLKGSSVNVIPHRYRGRLYPPRMINAVLKRLHISEKHFIPFLADDTGIFQKKHYDYALSIGGDLYTQSANRAGYPSSLIRLADHCVKQKIGYILWGASVGPFDSDPVAEEKVRRHLLQISGITAREIETVKYLHRLGIADNVVEVADPAFAVAPEIKKSAESFFNGGVMKIAVNFSPLSARYCGTEVTASQLEFIRNLLKDPHVAIVLAGHVSREKEPNDDDFGYLRHIYQSLDPEERSRVTMLPRDLGFIGTKKFLVECDCCVAARMHCAVNAMNALVPTFLLSYSQKAIGMCETVYGSRDYVFPLNQVGDLKIDADRLLKMYGVLQKNIPALQKKAYGANGIFTLDSTGKDPRKEI